MLSPIKASENIRDEFVSYISTSFHISDPIYSHKFTDELLKSGVVSKGPYLDISDSFESGACINELISNGEMSSLFSELEPNVDESEKEIKLERKLYLHQEKAIKKINQGKNLVVTTGTGSGKTECFILPIINQLLREKENGTLDDGVRAILIYPMNALANDQMKRLRQVLKGYPEITFGVYNSSTQHDDAAGIAEYGRIFKDEYGKALKPLPNESISRNSMQKKPPHILVTNYAMLEYMMLRPNDDLVFSGSKLSFLVLDEAHIYRGATGIETSLLIRRLKARISNAGNVKHILTSATLGGKETDCDIVKFASTLCDAVFLEEDIIRSKTVMPEFPSDSIDVPFEMFSQLAHPEKPMNHIFEEYGFDFPMDKSDAEILFDFCLASRAYRVLREVALHPMTVKEITAEMSKHISLCEDDVVNLIEVASQAEKNKTSLIKARYHMFVRALEGAYITLDSSKKLLLTRKNYTDDDDPIKVFEAAVCDDCGRIGIAGKTVSGRLEFASNSWDEDLEIYLLRDQSERWDDDEESEVDDEGEIGRNDFLVCSKCGMILHESKKLEFDCGHGDDSLVRLRLTEKHGVRNECKCPSCNIGHMKMFYIGYDAATAVLGTELFEQLPEAETVLKSKKETTDTSGGLFSMAASNSNLVEIIKKKRQFLTFSDSRSEAAYYACYMSSFYDEFLRRRGLWHVVEKNKESIRSNPWEISTLVNELTSYFDSNRSFASPGDTGTENLTSISRRQAWIAVLNEMVSARRSTSLVSLGILDFEYKGNPPQLMQAVAQRYNKSVSDMSALFNLLVMDIVYNGAIEAEDCSLTDEEREYIYYASKPRRFVKCKESDEDRKKGYLFGWIPRRKSNGVLFKNGRLQRICACLDVSEDEAVGLLSDYWNSVLIQSNNALSLDSGVEYYISTNKFVVKAGTEELPIYACSKCGRVTMTNCQDRCISLKCDGSLKRISHESILENNHFARLYSTPKMQPLHIKEHTAQLGRAEQQKYQEMFVKKEINALSCSTTFEMGVDVGDLETVYLRNMPPSPANYVQRAGRAGRSLHSAAYALTYSKLSSHDFTYFEKPERMISGKIGVPLFSISNEKVVLRHIFAVALSDFFKNNEDVYNKNDAHVLLNEDGYERLIEYLKSKPDDLREILKLSIPGDLHNTMGIEDFSWAERLIGDDGVLAIAVDDFRNTVKWYETEFARFKRQGDIQAAARCERQLLDYRRAPMDHRGRNELIEFLVRNNVLPKYGFPVDTVELYQGMDVNQEKRLQMVRDLQLAIAEYAPDAQVVADGKLYTSRYIRKLPQTTGQDWEEVYIAQCRNKSCSTWNHRITEPSAEGEKCVSCQNIIEKVRWKKAIEPRKGFIAESKVKDVPLRKPDRSFRSDDFYIGDPLRQVMSKKTFLINGDSKIQIENSSNDSLMVVCDDDFFICERCGYSISSISGQEDKDFNSFAKSYTKNHSAPWGKPCNGKLFKKSLCHAFKTDVVKLVFGTSRAKNKATMLSVMYSLLEAMSDVLDIERTDIKGCLHKVRYEKSMVYAVVLYDSVAGGAGHVRRLVTEDCNILQNVIGKAIAITKNCNCNPSCYNCLRNYYNQAVHDILTRVEAYRFLEEYYGNVSVLPDEMFEEHRERPNSSISENTITFTDSYPCESYFNWNDFSTMIPDESREVFVDFDQYRIPIPSDAYCRCKVEDTGDEFEIMFVWKSQKIMLFDSADSKVEVSGWKSLSPDELVAREFVEYFR